jgi:predicted ATP-dependent protease
MDEPIDGDSAGLPTVLALLSTLSNTPIKAALAVTGAINEYGDVLPVEGITPKVEYWFGVCASRGLNGEHGVVIPKANEKDLLLNPLLAAAVEAELFRILTVSSLEEAVEFTMGVPYDEIGRRIRKRHQKTWLQGAVNALLWPFRKLTGRPTRKYPAFHVTIGQRRGD